MQLQYCLFVGLVVASLPEGADEEITEPVTEADCVEVCFKEEDGRFTGKYCFPDCIELLLNV